MVTSQPKDGHPTEGCILHLYLKWSILIVQKLALHQNGVEFRQQFNGVIRISIIATYDDLQRHRVTQRHRDLVTHTVIDKADYI